LTKHQAFPLVNSEVCNQRLLVNKQNCVVYISLQNKRYLLHTNLCVTLYTSSNTQSKEKRYAAENSDSGV